MGSRSFLEKSQITPGLLALTYIVNTHRVSFDYGAHIESCQVKNTERRRGTMQFLVQYSILHLVRVLNSLLAPSS